MTTKPESVRAAQDVPSRPGPGLCPAVAQQAPGAASHPRSSSDVAARAQRLSQLPAAGRPASTAHYGRMFPALDPSGSSPEPMLRAGSIGGICAATAELTRQDTDGDDATEAAGWPFFGQLIAHDITADRSPVNGGLGPEELRNARSPRLNLEFLCADGPIGSPYQFDLADPAKFLLGPDGCDVPRNQQGVALIGDPRNDVHLFSQTLHLALMKAHNRIVDLLRDNTIPEADVFEQARITLTWHYQWIVIHDFLPRLVGASLVRHLLTEGGTWFAPLPGQAYIPLEFAHAAFRYGHGQIRQAYRLVDGGPAMPLFPDLTGFGPPPGGQRLDLAQVFDMPGQPPAQRARRIDGRLAATLIGLPEQVTGAVDAPAYHSLAFSERLAMCPGRPASIPH